jgi:hypothetical protein
LLLLLVGQGLQQRDPPDFVLAEHQEALEFGGVVRDVDLDAVPDDPVDVAAKDRLVLEHDLHALAGFEGIEGVGLSPGGRGGDQERPDGEDELNPGPMHGESPM